MDFQEDNSIFEHERLFIDFSLPVLVFFYPFRNYSDSIRCVKEQGPASFMLSQV